MTNTILQNSSLQENRGKKTNKRARETEIEIEIEIVYTHKKASWEILDKDTGNGPEKLLLFSLLLPLHDKNNTLKGVINN